MMEDRPEFDMEVRPSRAWQYRRPCVAGLLALACAATLVTGCGGSVESRARLWAAPAAHRDVSSSAYAVVLHWSGVPLAGQAGYYVSSDSARRADVAANSYTFTALECGTTHTLGVQAHDGNGNTSRLYTTSYRTPKCPKRRYRLQAGRRFAWNPGLNAVGGIPARTTVYKTLSPSGRDDTAAIQSALDSCPRNRVVQLTAGTFRISGQGLSIERSYCTLRGAGPGPGNFVAGQPPAAGTVGGTYLVKSAGSNYPVVIIGPRWGSYWGPSINLTANAVRGTHSVTLANAAGLAAGDLVVVDELTDPTLSHWNSQDPENKSGWFEEANRPLGDVMQIASIRGRTVNFTTPFPITYRVSQSAHLFRLKTVVRGSGIENVYMYGGEGGDGGGGIHLWNCAYCWVKHVEDTWTVGAAIHIDLSFRAEVRDSYFHDPQIGLHSGNSNYGIALSWYTSNTLIENNISIRFNKVDVMRSAGGGNVFGYNYMDDGGDQGGAWMEDELEGSHMTTPHYELFEGNEAANADTDDVWGNSIYMTYFRNHLVGRMRDFPSSAPHRAAGLTQWNWWFSFVGNVLGTPSHPAITRYQGVVNPPSWDGNMWLLCYQHADNVPDGGKCLATVLRDGNYDYVTKKVHWHGAGGVGENKGLTPPADSKLPHSMYLRAKPAFFGSNPWPWVDGSDAADPLPGKLPARVRYDAGSPNRVQ